MVSFLDLVYRKIDTADIQPIPFRYPEIVTSCLIPGFMDRNMTVSYQNSLPPLTVCLESESFSN